jgi:predicted DNA-binding transcriptional regulator YafY
MLRPYVALRTNSVRRICKGVEVDTAERLLALLGLLQRRLDWSADDLAERLDVTTRTIRRDVTRLRSYGYPVEAFAGHGGGYQLGRGGTLPPLLLDDDESLAVALGLRLTTFAALTGIDDAAVSALGKIEQLLPLRLRERLDHLDAVTIVDVRERGTDPVTGDRRTFTALARAAAGRFAVEFDYMDQRRAGSHRHVEPVRLVHARSHWYLVAYDLDRNDWRTFRVDRLTGAEVTAQRFSHRDGPDPIDLVEAAAPPDAFSYRAIVRVDCTPAEAIARIPPSIAVVSRSRPGCKLTIGTDDLAWLAHYLMSLPWPFEVLGPDALRAEVATVAGAVAARHVAAAARGDRGDPITPGV